MEQLVIVLIIGAVSLIKWLMERSADARARRNESAQAERREAGESPFQRPVPVAPPALPNAGEAARRLREALGLPPEEDFSPPVYRRSPPRAEPVILFERSLENREAERPLVSPASPFLAAAVVALSPVAPPPTPAVASASRPPLRSGLDGLLRSREGLRRAILVQEILGTPKGLVF